MCIQQPIECHECGAPFGDGPHCQFCGSDPKPPMMEHRCIILLGDMAGSKNVVEVSSIDIEYQNTCDNCGNILAPPEKVAAFLYNLLTGA